MDKSLDEMIVERQAQKSNHNRGRRPDRRNNDYPRDGVKKSYRDDSRDMDKAWIHDRFEEDGHSRRRRDSRDRDRRGRERQERRVDRYSPDEDRSHEAGAKLRVENLHYDLTESDLRELFTRVGPISSCEILYDRSDRSRGIAYVTYNSSRDAGRAIREFDGANAYGQPIQLTLLPSGPSSRGGSARGAAPNAGRSLFDRIDDSANAPASKRRGGPSRRDNSPRDDNRRMDMDGVDRYVPSDKVRRGADRSRSPRGGNRNSRRNGGGRSEAPGRRPGARRDDSRRDDGRDGEGRRHVGGRPRKTAEELDAEMEDYWGGDSAEQTGVGKPNGASSSNARTAALGGFGENSGTTAAVPGPSTAIAPPVVAAATTTTAAVQGDDIDMIE